MPLEASLPPLAERVEVLNTQFRHHSAIDVLHHVLGDPMIGPTALVSSFGTESIVLLHMLSVIDRTAPVLFLDTGMLHPETLSYQKRVTERLGLSNLRVIEPDREALFARDPDALLHIMDPNACCQLRKVEPLAKALDGFSAWITGRKRFQGGARQDLPLFEADQGRIKINPLAFWTPEMIEAYMTNNRLPRHPLAGRSMPSIGCMPCTSEVATGEDPRDGRWRGQDKTECGIHFDNGRALRS